MRKLVREETVLFFSVLKWFFLASATGIAVGCCVSLFLATLEAVLGFIARHPFYFLAMPAGFVAARIITHRFYPHASEFTTNAVIMSLHRGSRISPLAIPKVFCASIITIGTGGSAGKEAPCADIGAGIGALLSRFLGMGAEDYRKMVICGVSAGFAGTFGVPLAGALFGLEVLFVGKMLYEVLFPALVAGASSYYISTHLGAEYFRQPIPLFSVPSEMFFIQSVVAGIFFGLVSLAFVELVTFSKKLYNRIGVNELTKAAAAGVAVAAIGLIAGNAYFGLGMETVVSDLKGGVAKWYDPLLKMAMTCITLSFGGNGGVITPLFFIGSTSGSVIGEILARENTSAFAALGMVSVVAGVCNTPLAASVLALELFGPAIAPYAIISSVVSFLVTGHRGVYSAQILSSAKSQSLSISDNTELGDVRTEMTVRPGSLLHGIFRIQDSLREWLRRKS